ncbi:MAG TPA: hypothetical protein VGB95_02305 [Chitinophagales bacterium]
MMLFVGLLMVYLTGTALLLRFGKNFSWKETISFSFLIGIAAETFFMFLADVIGFGFTQLVLFFASFAVIALNYDLMYDYFQQKRSEFKLPTFSNYAAIILTLVIGYLFYVNAERNLYWATTEHDAISSFDKLGMVMANEGHIKISLFDYNLQGSGGIYPPLFHGAIAYVYLFGAENPKIITTLFYFSLLLGFYALAKKYVSSINALFFTLLLEMVPEIFAHGHYLLGNIPTATNVGMAALTLFVALDKNLPTGQAGDKSYLWLSAVLTAIALWTRNDIIGFAVAATAIVTVRFLRQKEWKTIGIYAAIAFSTFIIWSLYLKFKIAIPQTERFDFSQATGLRFKTMMLYIGVMLNGINGFGHELFGLTFVISFLFILLNIKNIATDRGYILVYILIAFLGYFLVFFFISEKAQQASISDLMESSFKRGLFCFIPPLLFYASTCKFSQTIFDKIERFRNAQ